MTLKYLYQGGFKLNCHVHKQQCQSHNECATDFHTGKLSHWSCVTIVLILKNILSFLN